jgi:Zn finger protein HypA/HybF involved in hydrogenase expression
MKQTLKQGVPTPTANIAINKSRLKVYGKKSEVPTYYLNKGQEFQIELFNPTTNNILAKISLNSKPIAQGGLVLRPGERVFLDRYIDVARKFKFDTYEVANTNEVKEAIKDNGDFKVEFYAEWVMPEPSYWDISSYYDLNVYGTNNLNTPTTPNGPNIRTTNTNYNYSAPVGGDINLTLTSNYSVDAIPIATASAGEATLDALDFAPEPVKKNPIKNLKTRKRRITKKSTIETGRVEMGSASSQEMTTVNMNWVTIPFHTVEYKMLPLSQKVNTVQDTQVKRYCSNCGTKQKPTFKFCPSCGAKA